MRNFTRWLAKSQSSTEIGITAVITLQIWKKSHAFGQVLILALLADWLLAKLSPNSTFNFFKENLTHWFAYITWAQVMHDHSMLCENLFICNFRASTVWQLRSRRFKCNWYGTASAHFDAFIFSTLPNCLLRKASYSGQTYQFMRQMRRNCKMKLNT